MAQRQGGPGRWSLDHLFLDAAGVPNFVEVKRASDIRLRRDGRGSSSWPRQPSHSQPADVSLAGWRYDEAAERALEAMSTTLHEHDREVLDRLVEPGR